MKNVEYVEIDHTTQVSREDRNQVVASFRNGTKHKFHDISAEKHRTYIYPDGSSLTIDGPLLLNTNHASGGHRLFDVLGDCHYVKGGWNEIKWRVYPGEDHFSK